MLLPFSLHKAVAVRDLLNNLHIAVVVAVAVVLMMQVALDEVVHVIAVRDRLVTAVRSMHVLRIVIAAGVTAGTRIGVGRAHFERVLINVPLVQVMKMSVMQEVGVAVVPDLGVTAVGTVVVGVVFVDNVGSAHRGVSFQGWTGADVASGLGVEWNGCSEA